MWAYVFEINIRATQKKSSGCCWCSPQFFEVAESHERNCQLMSSHPVSRPWGSNRDGLDQDKRKLWVQWKETLSAHLGVPAELREASVPENTGEKTDQVPFSPRHSLRELTPSSLRGDHVCQIFIAVTGQSSGRSTTVQEGQENPRNRAHRNPISTSSPLKR